MTARTRSQRAVLGTAVATCGLALGIAAGGIAAGGSAGAAPLMSPGVAAATPSETAEGLAFSREEERMARDLYAALAAAHDGARPMSMITTSEQRHFDAVGRLLTRYGVADPSAGRAAGSFAFPEIQALYDDWLARGTADRAGAHQVGVELEQRDIGDLKRLIAQNPPADVQTVYTNLLAGSEKHLAAFQRAASGGARPGMGAGRDGRRTGEMSDTRAGSGAGQGQGTQKQAGQGAQRRAGTGHART